jgi:membrane fusion protein (multidrug efflux system)
MSSQPGKLVVERVGPVAEAYPALNAQPSPLELSAPRTPKGRGLRKLFLYSASAVALAATGYVGWRYWSIGRFEVSTDDA